MSLVHVIGLSGGVQVVPKSVYESSLKKIGYRLYTKPNPLNNQEGNNNEKPFKNGVENEGALEEGEEEFEEDVESIPIGEMSGKQVKEYARIKGIDVSEARSTKEAKEIVRKWIQENGE